MDECNPLPGGVRVVRRFEVARERGGEYIARRQLPHRGVAAHVEIESKV